MYNLLTFTHFLMYMCVYIIYINMYTYYLFANRTTLKS